MSLNLSFSNKFKKVETPAESEEDIQKKKNKAAKANPLLNAKTDPYVDDNDAYQPRISRADRYEYWLKLLPNRGPRRPLPKAFKSWKSKEIASVNEDANYHFIHVFLFNLIKSRSWDHRYINLFILWMLLIIFFVDGWAEQLAPFLVDLNTGNQLLAIPPLLMFICQLVPFLGMVYFITHCNDLVNYRAIKEIGSWSFAAALTAQYCEFFLYRGQGRPERAGNCKKGHAPNPRPIYEYLKKCVNFLRSRSHAKVHSKDGEEEGNEEGDNDKTQMDEEEGAIKPKKRSKSPTKSSNKDSANSNDEESDIEAGTSKKSRKNKEKGLKSALKKSSTSNKEQSSEDEGPETNNSESKKRRKKSEKRKNSATIVEEEEHQHKRKSSNHSKGPLLELDKDGNVVEAKEVPHTDWNCIVCKTFNHKPTHAPVESDIWFGEKGVYYKRTYAVIQARRDVPTCTKCGTYSDYVPPMGTAHLFPHNPAPFRAFEDYPKPSAVQAGMKRDNYSLYYYQLKGFFFGIKDNINSAPLKNDWRLEKFVNSRFPELPRYVLKPGELHQIGEIIECRQQKFEWSRARIMNVHANNTYDIRYDPGDEIRFVEGRAIRCIPDKRAFAFRVEMGLVCIVLFTPLFLALGIMNANPGMGFVAPLVVGVALLAVRVVVFIQYFYSYYHAGLLVILKLTSIYTIPLLLLVIASAIGLSSGSTPAGLLNVAILLILTKVATLPYLYIYRPVYLVIGSIAFLQTSIAFVLLAMYAGNPDSLMYIAIPLAPFITLALCFKLLRAVLHSVWDVCLIIRKTKDTEFENPSILVKAKDFVMEYLDP